MRPPDVHDIAPEEDEKQDTDITESILLNSRLERNECHPVEGRWRLDEDKVVKVRKEDPTFFSLGFQTLPDSETLRCTAVQTQRIIHMELSSPRIKLDHLFCLTALRCPQWRIFFT